MKLIKNYQNVVHTEIIKNIIKFYFIIMNWERYVFLIFIFFLPYLILAQKNNIVVGKVVEYENNKEVPITGASVLWLNSEIGAITDVNGKFNIRKINNQNKLIVSSIGYESDTIIVNTDTITIVLRKRVIEIEDVTVTRKQRGIYLSTIEPIKVEKINEKELLKAACCNLSESFETNPSVDVSINDAITGTKQIQMLGLSSSYILITRENIPDFRGLSSIYGLTYIPGVWINSILLNKGTGSIINGYESISGQIDVQLKRFDQLDPLFINAYISSENRIEANVMFKNRFNDHLSNSIFIHYSSKNMQLDKNNDGFMDMPLSKQLNLFNRLDYNDENGLHFEAGLHAIYLENIGGQMNYKNLRNDTIWDMKMDDYRITLWSKFGKVNVNKPTQSIGLQLSSMINKRNSFYGLKSYDGLQQSYYNNIIYQDILFNHENKFKTGITFSYDNFIEDIDSISYSRKEFVGGIFYEYTYEHHDKILLLVGLRADYHSNYGIFLIPRIHFKYDVLSNLIFRASIGKGLRTSSIFIENSAIFTSSRKLVINKYNDNYPYGLKPELAWNYGVNLTYNFIFDYRQGSFSIDLYRTYFKDQVIVNLDESPQKVIISNLEGKSYSNSFQVQIDYELMKRLDLRCAYRFYDVKTTYSGILRDKPLSSKHRFFINSEYKTVTHWKFDLTINIQGPKRIPYTGSNPPQYRFVDYSPWYYIINSQISKTFKEFLDIYVGVENAFDYRQKRVIIDPDNPFSDYFDSSLIWGPIAGRNFYAGFRLRIR